MVIQRSGPVAGSPAEAKVFTTVLAAGSISRADIARRTKLSGTAVTRAANPLLDAGYLEYADDPELVGPSANGSQQGGQAPIRMGRPSTPLQVKAWHTGAIGIKITRDELVGVVADLAGSARISDSRPIFDPSVAKIVDLVSGLYSDLIKEAEKLPFTVPPLHLGVSLSGDIDHITGHVRYSPFLEWRDVPLGKQLASNIMGDVTVENDVKALTVAEQWFGMGRGITDFDVVTICTGIGCAIVVAGELVRGTNSVAGEIGHLPIADRSIQCHCGAMGCLEAEASTTAILRRCREIAGQPLMTADDAVELARGGNSDISAVFARAGTLIGRALASISNLLGPEQIIVAGEGVSTYDLFEKSIRDAFAEQAFGAAQQVHIHVRDLPFEEWARGAAAVAIQEVVFPSRLVRGTETREHRREGAHIND